jgi:hypothetical protein
MKKKVTRKQKENGKQGASRTAKDDILPEYDFKDAKPNPYAARYLASAHLVELDPDVAVAFPSAQAVNHALRALAGIINEHAAKPRRQGRKPTGR